MTDSTNETDDYTRNFIRHHLVPGLLRVNPGAQRAVGSMSEVLREQRDYLEGQAALALQRAERGEGYDVASLSSEHIALQRLAVSALKYFGVITGYNETEIAVRVIKFALHMKQTDAKSL